MSWLKSFFRRFIICQNARVFSRRDFPALLL